MSISVSAAMTLSVTETLAGIPFASTTAKDKQIVHNGLNETWTLNSGSTPPATQVCDFQKALSTGAGTIDLTAVPGSLGNLDLTGLKVQLVRFRNPSGNANPITVTFGAANGYLLLGTAWKMILQPGQSVELFLNDASPDVDATHKNIDIAGTGSQALDVLLVAG